MKRTVLFAMALLMASGMAFAQGYKVGDKAIDFNLKNVDGKMVSLSKIKDAKGYIVIFSCNHCPYVVAYEDRMIDLDKKYRPLGYPVVAINSNDPIASPDDSFDKMVKRAKDKGFTFPYVIDETQAIAKTYGATRTPHVFLLQKDKKDLVVKYIGAIDDNHQDASAVKETYLADAVDALLAGKPIATTDTKAIGCTIKWKK
ncbi:MAG: thioredoxin family protein [Breznakibacter sp.]